MLLPETSLYKSLTSGWEQGEPPTPESIRQGTVRMENHPDYEAAIQKALDAGFEIRISGEAAIEWIELYDLNQKLIRIEKILHVANGMRYIDLEHELDHIKQFTTRFGHTVPPLQKKIELPNGSRRNVDVLAGIMTTKHKIIVEYHNRLVEFIRLYERCVDIELLKDHAYGSLRNKRDGIEYWYIRYLKKGINWQDSTTGMTWVETYFPDIDSLKEQYDKAIEVIESGQYRIGMIM